LNGEDLLRGHRPIRHIVRIHIPAGDHYLVVQFVAMVPFSALAAAPEDPALLKNATSAEKRDHQEVRKCKERPLEVES
jgi:hypothetical protein